MKITITPTESGITYMGFAARLWEGVTEKGTKCHVFVAAIGVPTGEDSPEFAALQELGAAPANHIKLIPVEPA